MFSPCCTPGRIWHVRRSSMRPAINSTRAMCCTGGIHPPGRVCEPIFQMISWLPYVTAEYVASTGDSGILNEKIPFLNGEPLKEGENDRYAEFKAAPQSYSLYEHCRRAIEKGTTAGGHAFPLMRGGEWNDGMHLVVSKAKAKTVC